MWLRRFQVSLFLLKYTHEGTDDKKAMKEYSLVYASGKGEKQSSECEVSTAVQVMEKELVIFPWCWWLKFYLALRKTVWAVLNSTGGKEGLFPRRHFQSPFLAELNVCMSGDLDIRQDVSTKVGCFLAVCGTPSWVDVFYGIYCIYDVRLCSCAFDELIQ